MASCTSIGMFGGLVDEFIKQYETSLKDDSLSDIETNDTKEVLEDLYALRTAVKNNDKEYIKAHGFVQQQNEARQEVLEKTFTEVLGSTFSYTEGTSDKTKAGTLVSVMPTKNGVKLNFLDNGEAKSYTFSDSSRKRSHDNKYTKTFINVEGFGEVMDVYNATLDQQEQMDVILGSRASQAKPKDNLTDDYLEKTYVHGNLSHMKNMLKRLHVLGGEKASQEELDSFLDLIDKMSPSFFNDINFYLNEKAKVSEGTVNASRIDIRVSPKPRSVGNQQSEASIYMEEVVHSMVMAAMRSGVPKAKQLNRQLANLIEIARKQVTIEDFLPENSIDPKAEYQYAKDLYSYIFESKNASDEFLAKVVAMPEVSRVMAKVKVSGQKDKRRFLERVNDLVGFIVDIVKGNIALKHHNKNVHDAIVNLAFDFAEINNNANRKVEEKGSYLTVLMDKFNAFDSNVADYLDEKKEKILGPVASKKLGPKPDNLYGQVKWVAELITLSVVNPSFTKAMGAFAEAWGLKPDGTIREIIGGLFQSDDVQRAVEFLTMQAGYIDKQRNNQIDIMRMETLKGFREPISDKQEEALTEVISDTDLSSLFGNDSIAKDLGLRKTKYDNATLRKLLTDDTTLDRLITDAKKSLKELDQHHYHWHSNQAVGLGIYMATHRGTPEQNLNATNIARGVHSSHSKQPRANVVKAIDELATLVAIKNTNKDQRNSVASLMKDDWQGVQHVADIVEGFKKNSDVVFKNGATNRIKGYSREVFDDTIMMEVAPEEDRESMEAQGFTFKAKLAPRAGDARNKPMALYVTDVASRPDRLRGGVRLNQITSKGTTITETAYKDGEGFSSRTIQERAKRDVNNIQREAIARAKRMEEGEYDFTDTVFGVMPVINESGQVVDYRYMMDKETKKSLLKQDTRISEVMARSFGTLVDKDLSDKHNAKALDLLKKDMMENWTSGSKGNDGLTSYSLIGPDVADPEMRKLYYMLPKNFQNYIQNRADKTLAVRTDLRNLYFGYSNLSIADFPGLKKITPRVLIKAIQFAEMMWMEMVKIVKTNILMKMPTILISNIFSNLIYAAMRGYDPLTVTKMYVESYRAITAYNKDLKRKQSLDNKVLELSAAVKRDNLSERRKKELGLEIRRAKGEIKAIEKNMEKSNIHELVQLGLDQNVEDVTNDTEHDTNRIVNFFDAQLEKAPSFVRTGVDIAFITKRTKFYKVANEFLETSDLVARDVQNQLEKKKTMRQADGEEKLPLWWLEQQGKDYTSKQKLSGEERAEFLKQAQKAREYDLVEDFINYTKPSGRVEEYLNKVGILMFTKYVKRIQRIILKNSSNAPIKAALAMLTFGWLGGYPSIHEQSFLVKDWYGDSLGPGNVFPVYAPTDHFMNFITPSIIKASTYEI